jgi:transposase-like protein
MARRKEPPIPDAILGHHLAGEAEEGDSRNGYGRKSVTDTGKLALEVPRDRQASFDPQLIGPGTSVASLASKTSSSRCMRGA